MILRGYVMRIFLYYKHITYITSCFKLVLWYTAYNHFLCPHFRVCWFCRSQNKTGWWTTISFKYLNLECKSTGHTKYIHIEIRASQMDVCKIVSLALFLWRNKWLCVTQIFEKFSFISLVAIWCIISTSMIVFWMEYYTFIVGRI